MADQYKEFRVSNDAMDDPEELQRRIQDEGYLFFRKLQDPDKLLELRREMLTVIQAGGWLVAGTDPMDGIADISRQCTEGNSEYTDVYHEVYKLEAFHRSGHWPEVIDMMEKVIGQAGAAPSAEDCSSMVSEIYGTYHANTPRLCALPGKFSDLYLLGTRRRLPN